MAALSGNTIASTFSELLRLGNSTLSASAGTSHYIKDAADTNSALSINTTRVGIGTTSPEGELDIYQADNGSSAGPNLWLTRHSGSPADDDILGAINWRGRDDGGNYETMGKLFCRMLDVSDGTEDSYFQFVTQVNSTDTTAMTIGYSGKVGIGTVAPAYNLHVDHLSGAADTTIFVGNNVNSQDSMLKLQAKNGSGGAHHAVLKLDGSTEDFVIDMEDTAGAFTILQDGKVGIGTTPSNTLHVVTPGGTSAADLQIAHFNHTTNTDGSCLGIKVEFSAADPDDGAQTFIHCLDSVGNKFLCYSNGELWQAAGGSTIDSDERLKENIVDATSKLDDINKLKVRNFNLRKTDKETGQVLQKGEMASRKRIGFIAQELEEIFPSLIKDHETISAREAVEAVTAKDAVLDSDGNIVEEAIKAVEAVTERKQLIRKSLKIDVLVPMLVKAVQELSAKVEALENNNNQGDSSNEQEQEEPDSGASNGESAGEDSGGVEADSSDSSDTASGASEVSDPSSDDGDQSSGSSGSDSSDDSEGGSGGDDSSGSEGE